MSDKTEKASSGSEVIIARNEDEGIIVYVCSKCLKSYSARQESDYYRNAAEKCCTVSNQTYTRKYVEGDVDGPCFGASDTFFMDVEDAREQGELHVTKGEFTPYSLSVERLEEVILDGHHEDASASDLMGFAELCDAVDQFNAKQVHGSYHEGNIIMHLAYNQTFAMIKPCAVAAGNAASIKSEIEAAGFRIVKSSLSEIKRADAEHLYREHNRKEHFPDLVDFTISGPAELLIIEGDSDNVPEDFRKFAVANIRPRYTETIRRNGIHASDSVEASLEEIELFEAYFS